MCITFAGILLIISPLLKTCCDSSQSLPNGSQAIEYIELLKSVDDGKRQAGKDKLLELGPDSIGPLVSLLENISKDDFTPLFSSGHSKEGEEIWKLREKALNSGNDAAAQAATERLAQIEISGRLKNDIMEILGRLHAREAVPLLIRIMEQREIDNLWEKLRPEMYALAAIGSEAVPGLIQSIKDADAVAKRNLNSVSPYRLQVRSARVLGLIGDKRALPLLRDLLKQQRDILVSEAIKQIEVKNGIR